MTIESGNTLNLDPATVRSLRLALRESCTQVACIWPDSAVDHGAAFEFTLPRAVA